MTRDLVRTGATGASAPAEIRQRVRRTRPENERPLRLQIAVLRIFHNFGSTGPICKIFTFLEMALKFIITFLSGLRA